jgi:uncharacterized protein (DUF1501 family)
MTIAGCRDFRRHLARVNRRSAMKAGLLGAGGLSLAELLRADAQAAAAGRGTRRTHSVILLWMRGGPSQHETWDPKPDAPAEYRGAFGAMSTAVPGIAICDLLPKSAGVMDRWSIIRSLHHADAGHSSADQICFTGYPAGANPDENVMPSLGAITARQLQQANPQLPAYVMIPRMVPGAGSAWLGPAYKPFETQADPANDGPFQVRDFRLPDGLSVERVGARRDLLAAMDRLRRDLDTSGDMAALDEFQQQAWEMVTGEQARSAFDLDAEPREVRERYGFIPEFRAPTPDRCGVPAWSQRFVLARRLVEAGVRLVTVDCRWWDTHVQGMETMREGFLPRWDQAFSALIEDLDERGLLETTMVLAWGEFGRTPKVNAQNGRDHWPGVFSAALAGGGIRGGRVVGESDSNGAYPKQNPKSPQDVLATVYRHLGVDVAAHYTDTSGRPHPVLPSGTPIDELF